MKRGKTSVKKSSSLNNILAIISFLVAGYFSLKILNGSWYNYLLGVLFIVSGLYGIICYGKNAKFIF